MGDEPEEKNGSIHFMTLFNRQGKTRLAKWCGCALQEGLCGQRRVRGGSSRGSGAGWSARCAQHRVLIV